MDLCIFEGSCYVSFMMLEIIFAMHKAHTRFLILEIFDDPKKGKFALKRGAQFALNIERFSSFHLVFPGQNCRPHCYRTTELRHVY